MNQIRNASASRSFVSQRLSPRSVSVFVLSLLTSLTGFAAEKTPLDFETALVLPWKFIQSVMQTDSSEVTNLQYQIRDLPFSAQGVDFVVPTADVSARMHFKPVVSEQNETLWETDQLALQIQVAGFRLQKDIVQDLGGARAIVHLLADCSSFTLSQPSAAALMRWNWTVVDRNLNVHLKDLQLNWPNNSWQVSGLTCTGPAGFADLVQHELQAELAQADRVLPLLKSVLQSTLNTKITESLAKYWQNPQWLTADHSLALQLFGTGVVNSKGLVFRALLRLGDAAEVDPSKVQGLNLSDELLQSTGEEPTLIFSKEAIQTLLQQRNFWPENNYDLKQNSSFTRLLHSRFLQFFVWPDLWHYGKDSAFILNSKLAAAAKLNFTTSTGISHRVFVEAPISSVLRSQREKKTWNYIQLRTEAKATLDYTVRSGSLRVNLSSATAKTSAQFGAEYVKKYKPSTSFPLATLQSALDGIQQQQKSYNVVLPKFHISEKLVLQATSLTRPQDNYFFMEWSKIAK